MKRETIIYRGKKYHRYPESKRRQLKVYYWRHDTWKEPPVALHRQLWIDNFGEIPKGHIVHHKDGNSLNNLLDNFQLMERKEHSRMHMLTPERREMSRQIAIRRIPQSIAALNKFRKTKRAKLHQKFHVKESIHYAEAQHAKCLECNKDFTFVIKRGAKFCQKLCYARYHRKLARQQKLIVV